MHHPNARLSVYQRGLIVQRVLSGWTVTKAAEAAGVSRQTASKWLGRFRRAGASGLHDASSRPLRTRPRVDRLIVKRVLKARLRFRRGPRWLAWTLRLAASTVYLVLRRAGMNRLCRRDDAPVVRYEWPNAGDMIHLDIKKLGRIGQGGGKRVHGPSAKVRTKGLGWDFVHVAIDDHSRLAYAEICPDEREATTAAFTERAVDFFEAAGIEVRRILTDNGSAYRSRLFARTLAERAIEMRKTRPYRPQTNGKAEAFVKILTREWAYGQAYQNTKERADSLGPFLRYYNLYRPHGGIGGQTPISRV